jgi:hypothetical protein
MLKHTAGWQISVLVVWNSHGAWTEVRVKIFENKDVHVHVQFFPQSIILMNKLENSLVVEEDIHDPTLFKGTVLPDRMCP